MPTYSYRCTECGNAFDIQQAFTDSSLTECPSCSGALRKLYSSVGVTFKGSGFYRTDSRSDGSGEKSAQKSGGSSSEKSSSGTSSDKSSSSGSGSNGSGGSGSSGTGSSGSSSSGSGSSGSGSKAPAGASAG